MLWTRLLFCRFRSGFCFAESGPAFVLPSQVRLVLPESGPALVFAELREPDGTACAEFIGNNQILSFVVTSYFGLKVAIVVDMASAKQSNTFRSKNQHPSKAMVLGHIQAK